MKTYLNSEVARIMGLTQRQVLNWTEKGLVIPYIETSGAGSKREYNYINLLEFGLCKKLYEMGMGMQGIKRLLSGVRGGGWLEKWADDFSDYYETRNEYMQPVIDDLEQEWPADMQPLISKMRKQSIPPTSTRFLFFFFGEREETYTIIPQGIDYVFNLILVKEEMSRSYSCIVVDLGKIKRTIERNL